MEHYLRKFLHVHVPPAPLAKSRETLSANPAVSLDRGCAYPMPFWRRSPATTLEVVQSTTISPTHPHETSFVVYKAHVNASCGVTMGSSASGVAVLKVAPGGECERGGLRSGDLLRSINGAECCSDHELAAALLRSAPAGFVEIAVSCTSFPGKRPVAAPIPVGDAIELIALKPYEQTRRELQPQIAQLVSMGFDDADACQHALLATDGNVEQAVVRLIGSH